YPIAPRWATEAIALRAMVTKRDARCFAAGAGAAHPPASSAALQTLDESAPLPRHIPCCARDMRPFHGLDGPSAALPDRARCAGGWQGRRVAGAGRSTASRSRTV
ncbi:hypothetical protein ACFWAD_29690, partial [Rhodococcus sp. NPDC059969]|uniref:hypothetical protein n=1 Tax=Rhodococcus sp. NPDC059969 TaxID=3347018 RepID=UPI0036703F35